MDLLSCAFSGNPLAPLYRAFSLMLIVRTRLATTEEILAMFDGKLCKLVPGDVEDRAGEG